MRGSIDYFWLIFNGTSLYDRYNWAIHHASDEELEDFGGYQGVPTERVDFNKDVYGNFSSGLQGWRNRRCGQYAPPIDGLTT